MLQQCSGERVDAVLAVDYQHTQRTASVWKQVLEAVLGYDALLQVRDLEEVASPRDSSFWRSKDQDEWVQSRFRLS